MKLFLVSLFLSTLSYGSDVCENLVSVTWGVSNQICHSRCQTVNKVPLGCAAVDPTGHLEIPKNDTTQISCYSRIMFGSGPNGLTSKHVSAELKDSWRTVSDSVTCQNLCQLTDKCTHFEFYQPTGVCALLTGTEVGSAVSTKVDDVVVDPYLGVPYLDPRWHTCDMSRARECSKILRPSETTEAPLIGGILNQRNCLSCADSYRCVYSDEDAISGPALCSKYQRRSPCEFAEALNLNRHLLDGKAAASKPSSYCNKKGFDVMFLQEATAAGAGYVGFFPWTGNAVGSLFSLSQPDGRSTEPARLGLDSFRDKPVAPYGDAGDYCFRKELALTSNWTAWNQAYAALEMAGGGDELNDQLTALAAAATSSAWNENSKSLVVVVATSPSHYPQPSHPFSEAEWNYTTADDPEQCVSRKYASPKDLRRILKLESDIDVIFLTTLGPHYYYFAWFNEYLAQPAGYVQVLSDDGSNLLSALSNALETLLAVDCKIAPLEANSITA